MLTPNQSDSYLQSEEWGELQKNLGREVLRVQKGDFSTLLIKYQLPFGLNYFYAPRGPNGPLEKLETLISEIKKTEKHEKVMFLRIEPPIEESQSNQEVLRFLGFKKTKPVQPQNTIILDLKKTEEELSAKLDKDTRYAVRTATKRGVEIVKIESPTEKQRIFDEFWEIFAETNDRHTLKAYSKKYYQEVFSLSGKCQSKIFLARVGDKTVSAALIIHFAKSAVYSLAASRAGYGGFNAPSLLLWKAVLDAKASGLAVFDLWGVDEKNKKWSGITSFKKNFGGQAIRYIGTWDFILSKKWYFLYNLSKKLR